jgi:hypothetical protein
MPGTITISTLSDGADSTSATNLTRGACNAWVNFNGTNGAVAIRDSYNVSSVTRTASGNYTVNYTNAFPNVNYAVAFGGQRNYPAGANMCIISIPSSDTTPGTTTTSISVVTQDQAGNQNDSLVVCISCFYG